MPGRIFLVGNDGDLHAMDATPYPSEDHLQDLLARYPDLIPGSVIDPATPRRWLLVSREAGVPKEEHGGSFWALDHLFLDQVGVPTLVEVKRSDDTRLRREVVGQMLDYAANGVAYWPVERLQALLDRTAQESGADAEAVLADFLDGSAEEFWRAVKTNLQAGRVRLIFVSDQIPAELQRVVEFLNTQMDPAEVLAVEIPRFSGSGLETLVPRVVGQTEEARTKKGARLTRQWDASSFLQELGERVGGLEAETAKRVMDWCDDRGFDSSFGQGATSGSYFPVVTHAGLWYAPFALWTYGQVETQFQYLKERPQFSDEATRAEMLSRFNRISEANLPASGIDRRPSFSISLLTDDAALETFFATIEWFLDRLAH